MISELILIFLKYTGGFIAASYGVYATLTDFRTEENGKKVLTRKGYFGIALLVTSSVLALSVDGFKDYNAYQKDIAEQKAKADAAVAEAERIRVARENEQLIIGQLGTQSTDLTTALGVLKDNAVTSERISIGLGTQLGITKGVSNTLGSAVKSLNETSQTTNALLQETVNRIDFYTVSISVTVDPVALKNNSALEIFSPKALQGLKDEKAKRINLAGDLETLIENEFRTHLSLVRKSLFKNWSFSFWLDNQKVSPGPGYKYMEVSFQGEDGLPRLELDYIDAGVFHCTVSYTLPPVRSGGFRQYKDLNGARWAMGLGTDPDILQVDDINLYVGSERGLVNSKFVTLAPKPTAFATIPRGMLEHTGRGSYSGELMIPANYF